MNYTEIEIEWMKEILRDKEKEINRLEEENKKLNENIAWYEKEEDRLREENKKLKEELKKDDREVQVDVDKELLKANDYLIKENKNLKESLDIATKCSSKEEDWIIRLSEENKKLNEFKTKREESMFYFKAQMERAEPKTAREAEDLQKAKEIFEGLYREELSCLEEENNKLKEEIKFLEQCLDNKEKVNKNLREDLKIWKLTDKDYAKQCWVDLDDN